MSSANKTHEIPDGQFPGKGLAGSVWTEKIAGYVYQAFEGSADSVTRHAQGVGDILFGLAIPEALRDSAPVAPATVVFASQPIGGDVVVDDEVGDMESAEACGEEAAIEFSVFVGEKAFAAAAHLRRVFPDAIKDAAADDGVSTHEIARK